MLVAPHPAIQKGTRVLISLWDSLVFGRVPGTRPNISESHSEIRTLESALLCCGRYVLACAHREALARGGGRALAQTVHCGTSHGDPLPQLGRVTEALLCASKRPATEEGGVKPTPGWWQWEPQ